MARRAHQIVQIVLKVPALLSDDVVHVLHEQTVVVDDDVTKRRQNVAVVLATVDDGYRQTLKLSARELVKIVLQWLQDVVVEVRRPFAVVVDRVEERFAHQEVEVAGRDSVSVVYLANRALWNVDGRCWFQADLDHLRMDLDGGDDRVSCHCVGGHVGVVMDLMVARVEGRCDQRVASHDRLVGVVEVVSMKRHLGLVIAGDKSRGGRASHGD